MQEVKNLKKDTMGNWDKEKLGEVVNNIRNKREAIHTYTTIAIKIVREYYKYF